MLVDNAIVVTDNAQVGIKRGLSRYQALVDGATKPQWALLGATFIAVCSFLPMYLAPASVAEIVKPLFIVLGVSLGLSWILALTQTTTFGNFILKEAKPGESKDPYDTKLYHKFENVLGRLIKRRYLTLTSVVATLFLSFVHHEHYAAELLPDHEQALFSCRPDLPGRVWDRRCGKECDQDRRVSQE